MDSYFWEYDGFQKNADLLWRKVDDFVDNNILNHLSEYNANHSVTDMRLLTVETKRAFGHMQAMNWTPQNVKEPRDRYIRGDAGTEMSPTFQDPGNDNYCLLYHILRLDKYLSEASIEKVIKTLATQYGAARNRSSVGVVNLRGKLIEAILSELQTMSTVDRHTVGKKRQRKS